jgi:hypothetical protein
MTYPELLNRACGFDSRRGHLEFLRLSKAAHAPPEAMKLAYMAFRLVRGDSSSLTCISAFFILPTDPIVGGSHMPSHQPVVRCHHTPHVSPRRGCQSSLPSPMCPRTHLLHSCEHVQPS